MKQPCRVLLVEDHALLGDMMVQMLQMLGCQAQRAQSVADARSQWRDDFDLVLCDMNLPDGSAVDIVRALKPGSSSRFYLLSAFDEQTLRHEAEQGFDGYLTKPVDVEQLEELIRTSCQ